MSAQNLARVAIVSEQPIFLRGLASLVTAIEGFKLVGEARQGVEALQLCRQTEPDLILVDLVHTPDHGQEIARHISQKWPSMRVVLVLGVDHEDLELDDNGQLAIYGISRNASEEELKAALQQILRQPLRQGGGREMAQAILRHHAGEELEGELSEPQPAIHTSHLHRNEEVIARELVMAGKIQEDILPEKAPTILGWDISARLLPARETSGDFYDFIPLSDRKLGVVISDVTDKGMGAALFMALSSTLIRTYAARFPTLPGLAMNAVSERLLTDTRGGMYVTTFFGILEPPTGRFVYANAGHPPGFLISTQRAKISIEQLRPTGMALGVSEAAQWRQKIARLGPGDYLVLYTDGITETQNRQGVFFGEERLMNVVLSRIGRSAREVQDALVEEVNKFEGYIPQQDDIALIVIRRNKV
jgi:serine phosphatase RsbU (regulator of sigma subunit)